MDPNSIKTMAAAAGAGGDKVYVDDVFSTYIYQGNSGTNAINNGVDLDGEGGLVWLKVRTTSDHNLLYDTERGATKQLITNENDDESTESRFSSFNSDGFTVTTNDNEINNSAHEYVAWSFRKAPGFFDIVTYTGNGVEGRDIAHSLGSVPGMMIVKNRDTSDDWRVYHRAMSADESLRLNLVNASGTTTGASTFWNDTRPTASVFTVGNQGGTNEDGKEYVCYLFAHDDARFGKNDDEIIIQCGYWIGDGTAGNTINLGFEPQWLMFKNKSNGASGCDWYILDQYRNFLSVDEDVTSLEANNNDAEETAMKVNRYSNGFVVNEPENDKANASSHTYVYVAIRRPNKPPTAATEVFKVSTRNGNETADQSVQAGFPVDMAIIRGYDVAAWTNVFDRERGALRFLVASENNAESLYNNSLMRFDYDMEKIIIGDDSNNLGVNRNSTTYVDYLFKRATGFFDIVYYDGTGSARTIDHNLGAVPEMMFVKKRSSTAHWRVYHSATGNTKAGLMSGTGTDPFYTASNIWNDTTPTATQFTVGSDHDVNDPDDSFIAYLFGSLSGISKVGSYSGTGSDIEVDCGFSAGAKFVLIKRSDTETQGDAPARTNWYVWDSERGIVSGDDPWFAFNETHAEVTDTDYIDPLTSGFKVVSDGGGLNTSGGTYVYLAFA